MGIAKQELFYSFSGNASGKKKRTLIDGCFCFDFEVINRNLRGFGSFGFSSERNT